MSLLDLCNSTFGICYVGFVKASVILCQSLLINCMEMGQRQPTSQAEAKQMAEEREAEYQARQDHKWRQAAALQAESCCIA